MAPESKQTKRKASTAASSSNVKKPKKAAPTANKSKAAVPVAITISATSSTKPARAIRKTAADFLSESEESDGGWDTLKNGKSDKKKTKSKPTRGTITEKAKVIPEAKEEDIVLLETKTTDAAEEKESDSEDEDQTATLLQGFESSDEDMEDEHTSVDGKKIAKSGIPNEKKVKKQLKELSGREKTTAGIIYLGRIPHGFYEHEMRSYFSQFGTVTRLRLSRNKKTGKSKHYAFIEFADEDVASIVADTMNNYLLFGHILKCKVVPRDNVEYIEKLMKGANKRFKPRPAAKLAKAEMEKKKPEENWEKVVESTNEKRKVLKKKWEARGIEYDFTPPMAKKAKAVAVAKENEVIVEASDVPAVEAPSKDVKANGVSEAPKKEAKKAEEAQPKGAPKAAKKAKKSKKAKA